MTSGMGVGVGPSDRQSYHQADGAGCAAGPRPESDCLPGTYGAAAAAAAEPMVPPNVDAELPAADDGAHGADVDVLAADDGAHDAFAARPPAATKSRVPKANPKNHGDAKPDTVDRIRKATVDELLVLWTKQGDEWPLEETKTTLDVLFRNKMRVCELKAGDVKTSIKIMLTSLRVDHGKTFTLEESRPPGAPKSEIAFGKTVHRSEETETHKIIVWGVSPGRSARSLFELVDAIARARGAQSQLVTVQSVHPDVNDVSGYRVEIVLHTEADRKQWKEWLEPTAAINNWKLKSGRGHVQRQADRVWAEIRADGDGGSPRVGVAGSHEALKLVSWNVNGMVNKLPALEKEFDHAHLIFVQEHWLPNTFKPCVAGYSWIGVTSRTTKGGGRGRQSGVGVLVHENIEKYVSLVDSNSDNLMAVRYQSPSDLFFVVNAYAPTDSTHVATRQEYFSRLEQMICKWRDVGPVVLVGDLNAKLACQSKHVGQYHKQEKTNRNTDLVEGMLRRLKMDVLNGRNVMQQADHQQWTRVRTMHDADDGKVLEVQEGVIDYVCVPLAMLDKSTLVVDDRQFQSDHRPLIVTLDKVLVQKPKEEVQAREFELRPNWQPLIHDGLEQRIVGVYTQKLDEAFDDWTKTRNDIVANAGDDNEALLNKLYHEFVVRLSQAVKDGVPHARVQKTGGAQHTFYPWYDRKVRNLQKEREACRQKLVTAIRNGGNTADALKAYKEKAKETRALANKKKDKLSVSRQVKIAHERVADPKRYWTAVKNRQIKGGVASRFKVDKLKNPETGGAATDATGIAEAFRAHSAALFNDRGDEDKFDKEHYQKQVKREETIRQALDDESKKTDEWFNKLFTAEELHAALTDLSYHKAADHDGLRAEMFKFAMESSAALDAMLDIFNRVWETGVVPTSWQEGSLIYLPKAGDLTLPSNYRGIMLLSIMRKVYDKLLVLRAKKHVEHCEEQGGFRANRSCPDQVFVLYNLLERRRHVDHKATYLCFVDFKKAFDRVYRDMLKVKMYDGAGIKGRLHKSMAAMMDGTKARVRYNGKLSSLFDITMGVAQGGISSPMLFAIFVDDLAAMLKETGVGIKLVDQLLNVLLFADDTVLMAETADDLRKLLTTLEAFCNKWRLEVNETKTEVMIVPDGNGTGMPAADEFTYGNKSLNVVDKYKYLGVWIHKDLTWKYHVNCTLDKATKALNSWTRLLNNPKIGAPMKLTCYKAMVRPVMEYAAEVWTADATQLEALEGLQRRCARMITGAPNATPKPALLLELGLPTMAQRYERIKLNYVHKVALAPANRFIRMLWDLMDDKQWTNQWCSLVRPLLVVIPPAKEGSKDAPTSMRQLLDKARDTIAEADVDERAKVAAQQRGKLKGHVSAVVKYRHEKFMRDWIEKDYSKTDLLLPTRASCSGDFGDLATYMRPHVTMTQWHAQRLQLMLRAGNAPLAVELKRWRTIDGAVVMIPRDDRHCDVCKTAACEDQKHFLTQCPHEKLKDAREALKKTIKDKLVDLNLGGAVRCWDTMSDADRCKVLMCNVSPLMSTKADGKPEENLKTLEATLCPLIAVAVWKLFTCRAAILANQAKADERSKADANEELAAAVEARVTKVVARKAALGATVGMLKQTGIAPFLARASPRRLRLARAASPAAKRVTQLRSPPAKDPPAAPPLAANPKKRAKAQRTLFPPSSSSSSSSLSPVTPAVVLRDDDCDDGDSVDVADGLAVVRLLLAPVDDDGLSDSPRNDPRPTSKSDFAESAKWPGTRRGSESMPGNTGKTKTSESTPR